MAIGAGLGGLVGGIINAADPSQGSKKYAKQALGLWRDLPEPDYSDEIIPWQQLLLAGQITPETYEAIAEPNAAQVGEDPAMREMQLRAALGFEQVGREGLPLQDRLLADEAQRSLAGEFSRANEGIMSNLAQRGRAGGGTELAARLAASGSGAEMARGMGSDLAMQSIQNRLMGMREAGGMAGDIRGQDADVGALNAEMTNRYNEFLASLRTGAARDAAGSRERAQQYNVGQAQRLSDANTLGGYESRLGERGRQDDLQDRLYTARMNKIKGQTGALDWVGQAQNARETAKEERTNALGLAGGSIVDSLLAAFGGPKGALLAK